MYSLYQKKIVRRDVSFAEITIEHKQLFTANSKQVGKGFQQFISKAAHGNTNYATSTNKNSYHLDIDFFALD